MIAVRFPPKSLHRVTISEMLGKQVFGGSSGQPQLSLKVYYSCSSSGTDNNTIIIHHHTSQEYEEECSKLEGILSTMEQNIKKLLADFDTKKKVYIMYIHCSLKAQLFADNICTHYYTKVF